MLLLTLMLLLLLLMLLLTPMLLLSLVLLAGGRHHVYCESGFDQRPFFLHPPPEHVRHISNITPVRFNANSHPLKPIILFYSACDCDNLLNFPCTAHGDGHTLTPRR
jgi:hypothetical protein